MFPRGYVKIKRDAFGYGLRDKIKKLLTVVPVASSSFSEEEVIMRLWHDDGEYLGVPRGFYNTRLKGKYVEDCEFDYSAGSNAIQESQAIALRDGQAEIIKKAIDCLGAVPFGGCIIEAKVASGKTVLGLEIARRLNHKSLVIVHTSVLMDQWKEEIKKFFPHWRVGTLQADKVDIENKDIVIGMLQSCSMKEYPEHIYEDFGLVMPDEVHTMGAPEFSKVLEKFTPKYFLGLSGTVQRKDRAESVFIHGIGPVISGMNEVTVLDPQIYFVDTEFTWRTYLDRGPLDRQKAYFLREVIVSEERNEMIIQQALKALEADRKVLILSERVSHVEDLASKLKRRTNKSVGVMVGASTKAEREVSQEADVIVATVQLIGTGFNKPDLSVLIFATPIQQVEQSIGRVRRIFPGKKQPIVLDLVDSNSHLGLVFGMARLKRYRAQGFEVFGNRVFDKLRKRNG